MSTRSSISIKNEDRTFRSIYCHFDGYLDYVGRLLVENYKTKQDIEKLLDLGDLSCLGKTPVDEPKLWDFEWEIEHRDESENLCRTYKGRGEKDVDSKKFNSINEIVDHYDWSEYHYIFIDNEWYYVKNKNDKLKLVKDYL